MIRTNVVKLDTIQAMAYRQKLSNGDKSIIIVRADLKQPGIAAISNKTGEPVPTANTNKELFPVEAFEEAIELTRGMPYKKQGSIKVTPDMFYEETVEEEVAYEEPEFPEEAYDIIVDHYTDKNGKLSYELLNKELITFAHKSTIVKGYIDEGKSVKFIREYIVGNKFRNIAGDPNLTDEEIQMICDRLDEAYTKGVFKDLNEELKQMSSKAKGKGKK